MSRKSAAASPFEGGYRFTQINGAITGVQEMEKGRWKNEKIDRNESWSTTENGIIKTETDRDGSEVTLYVDTNGDGVYFEAYSWKRPVAGAQDDLYRFGFAADGRVTSIQEWDDGRWEVERPDRNETYVLQDGLVIRTEMEKGRVEWTVFADSNGDGTWTELADGKGALDLIGVKSLLAGLTAEGLVY
ncbi:hypothetical protein [Niveispirillum fermenti]|uniref:hypothetical protein n=1 Tax=Niveispirillum fermenti TaxID=1233113 RepID=UPI003A846E0F